MSNKLRLHKFRDKVGRDKIKKPSGVITYFLDGEYKGRLWDSGIGWITEEEIAENKRKGLVECDYRLPYNGMDDISMYAEKK